MSKSKKGIIGEILYTEEDIKKRAEELGAQISKDYEGQDLVIIGTLKGSFMWLAELVKRIDLDAEIDFVSASSYGSGTTSSGFVKVEIDTEFNLYNKQVLIVEDIVDTGNTLAYLLEQFKERSSNPVKICTMLDKPSRRINNVKADYVGFTVDDIFIIGYGLDYDQRYRNLPYISYLTDAPE